MFCISRFFIKVKGFCMCPLCLTQVSWIAILVGAVVSFFVGMLWYSPVLFADRWARLSNFKFDENVSLVSCMIGAFCIALLQSYGIAWFLENTQSFSLIKAYTVVSLLTLIFVGSQLARLFLWERRPFQLIVINLGCEFVASLAVATLFVYMVG